MFSFSAWLNFTQEVLKGFPSLDVLSQESKKSHCIVCKSRSRKKYEQTHAKLQHVPFSATWLPKTSWDVGMWERTTTHTPFIHHFPFSLSVQPVTNQWHHKNLKNTQYDYHMFIAFGFASSLSKWGYMLFGSIGTRQSIYIQLLKFPPSTSFSPGACCMWGILILSILMR
jgi:hypothetical protein